jgi:hypothetical protein
MSTHTALDLGAITNAVDNGGVAALADYATDDIEFREIDQTTPPAAPAVYRGREALSALAEELERRGVHMRIDDGFIAGDDGSTGHDVGLSTLMTPRELLFHSQVILTTGQLAFQGILHRHDHNTPGTILGGTGAYDGARGTARITDLTPTTAKVTIDLVG